MYDYARCSKARCNNHNLLHAGLLPNSTENSRRIFDSDKEIDPPNIE